MSSSRDIDLKKSSTVELLEVKREIESTLFERARAYQLGIGWRYPEHTKLALYDDEDSGETRVGLELKGLTVLVEPETFDRCAGVEVSL